LKKKKKDNGSIDIYCYGWWLCPTFDAVSLPRKASRTNKKWENQGFYQVLLYNNTV
jgi:hypothetical protein